MLSLVDKIPILIGRKQFFIKNLNQKK